MKILTIGSGMYDLFLEHETAQTFTFEIDGCDVDFILLEEGRKVELNHVTVATGGGSINAATTFAKLNLKTAAFCKLGSDEKATYIINELKKRGIDHSLIKRSDTARTGTSYIIPSPTGNSAILVDRAANLSMQKNDLPMQKISDFDLLYITSLSSQTAELLPIICAEAHKHGLPIATNPGMSQLSENVKTLETSLKYIHTLILNTLESTLLMEHLGFTSKNKKHPNPKKNMPPLLSSLIKQGSTSFLLEEYFKEIHSHGVKVAIVTNGEDGIYASDGTHIYYHPSLPIDVISTVGAGDAFAATFISQRLKQKSIEDAIRAGVINSASVLEHLGATTGLCTQQELDEMIDDIDKKGIKKFPLV